MGRPGEQWPETGAARFYVNNDEWRTAVRYFIKNANVVVITIGSSSALRWELAEVLKTIDRAKVLFFFPYPILRKKTNLFVRKWSQMWLSKNTRKYMQTERQKKYTVFKNDAEKILNCKFPEFLDATVFIDFDNYDKPRLLQPKRPSLFTNIMQVSFVNKYVGINLKKTLQPFLEKLKTECSKNQLGIGK